MDNKTKYKLVTRNAEQTRSLGRLIGQSLQNGIVIRLLGDLGSGKTCFVQGLAIGLKVPEGFAVTSPTYTLINEFPGRMPLFHVDLYRIHSSDDAEAIGFYDIMTPKNVVAVEWAERLSESEYPKEHLSLSFQTRSNDSRHIEIIGSGLKTSNLIKNTVSLWDNRKDGTSQ